MVEDGLQAVTLEGANENANAIGSNGEGTLDTG